MSDRRDTRRVARCSMAECRRPIRLPLAFDVEPDPGEWNCMSCSGWDRASPSSRRDFYSATFACAERINPYVQYAKT